MLRKPLWIMLGIFGALIIGGGVWLLLGTSAQKGWLGFTKPDASQTSERVDFTDTEKVNIAMRDLSFRPANIKVKKGTEVTWTNEEGQGHSVVADDLQNHGGLPTKSSTISLGQTTAVTFNIVGTFRYHCEPHSFMRGSVEVVE